MAIYIGGANCKLVTGKSTCNMKFNPSNPVTNGVRLLSSDDYTLMDSKWLYITAIEYINSLSSDGFILQDAENNYLVIKKG